MNSPPGTAFLLISLLVSGYILATQCYAFKYKTARESGHRLYLTCAALGFLVALSVEILYYSIHLLSFLLSNLPWTGESLKIYGNNHTLTLSILSPIAAFLFTIFYNLPKGRKNKNLKKAWEKDDLSSLIRYATSSPEGPKPIAVTLESRKIYIGLVARTNEPDAENAHLTLLPLYSGYREESNLHLHITNIYESVFDYYADNSSTLNIKDLYIVIPISKMVSAHIFNHEIYDEINQ